MQPRIAEFEHVADARTRRAYRGRRRCDSPQPLTAFRTSGYLGSYWHLSHKATRSFGLSYMRYFALYPERTGEAGRAPQLSRAACIRSARCI
eukprot:5265019-Pleurochrysis_carterae.AAC.1